jgi:hypothetical protein
MELRHFNLAVRKKYSRDWCCRTIQKGTPGQSSILILVNLVIIQCIHTADFAPLLVQLLVVSPQKADVHQTQHCAGNGNPKSRPESSRIIRRFMLDENIARHKVRAIANTQYDCCPHGQARASAQVVRQPRGGHCHLDKGAGGHTKQAEVADCG